MTVYSWNVNLSYCDLYLTTAPDKEGTMANVSLRQVLKFLDQYGRRDESESIELNDKLKHYDTGSGFSPESVVLRNDAIAEFDLIRSGYIKGTVSRDDYLKAQRKQDELIAQCLVEVNDFKTAKRRQEALTARIHQYTAFVALLVDDLKATGDCEFYLADDEILVEPEKLSEEAVYGPDVKLQNEILCALYLLRFEKRVDNVSLYHKQSAWKITCHWTPKSIYHQLFLMAQESDPRVVINSTSSSGQVIDHVALTDTGVKFVVNSLLATTLADISGMNALCLLPLWAKKQITFIDLVVAVVVDLGKTSGYKGSDVKDYNFKLSDIQGWFRLYADKSKVSMSIYCAVRKSAIRLGDRANFRYISGQLTRMIYALTDSGIKSYEERLKPFIWGIEVKKTEVPKKSRREKSKVKPKAKKQARKKIEKKTVKTKRVSKVQTVIRLAAHQLLKNKTDTFTTTEIKEVLLSWAPTDVGDINTSRISACIINNISRSSRPMFKRVDVGANERRFAKKRLFALSDLGQKLSQTDRKLYRNYAARKQVSNQVPTSSMVELYRQRQVNGSELLTFVVGMLNSDAVRYHDMINYLSGSGLSRGASRSLVAKVLKSCVSNHNQFICCVTDHVPRSRHNRYALTEKGRTRFGQLAKLLK